MAFHPIDSNYRRRVERSDLPDEEEVEAEPEAVSEVLAEEDDPDTGDTIVYLDPKRKNQTEDREFYANLAEDMDQARKDDLVMTLLERIEVDKNSRKKRDEQYEEGIRRTGLGDDAPGGAQFDGASRVVHPVMAEGCVDFAASEMKELFPPDGPTKTQIVGKPNAEKQARAERKSQHMNLQITQEVPEYRAELEQLLTQLPLGGSQYMHVRRDEDRKRPTIEFVPIDDVLVPFASTYFYHSQRITRVLHLINEEIAERIESGLYLEFDYEGATQTPEQTKAADANDKIEGKEEQESNEDGLRDIYEISTILKLDEEDDPLTKGKRAPYLVTIDPDSMELLAVYRNWEEDDEQRDRLDFLIEFQFIPWRGAYGIGLIHLIGSLSGAATGALRALLDSALINNMPTLVKAKGRPGGQSDSVSATQVTEVDVPSGKSLRESLQQLNFPEPSVVLYQLLGFLVTAAKGVVTTAEEKIADASNSMPVGTTLALIEQGSKVASSIHARMHASQARVLKAFHRQNRLYLDDKDVLRRYGEQIATRADYEGAVDVIPVSDPAIFSETQRVAQAQAVAARSKDAPDLYDRFAVEDMVLERLRIPDRDRLLLPHYEAENTDAVDENVSLSLSRPVMAYPEQDHLAHLTVHLSYFTDQRFGASLLIAPVAIMGVVQHVREHLALWYRALAFKLIGDECGINPEDDTVKKSPEEMVELDRAFALATHIIHGMKDDADPTVPDSKPETPPEIAQLLPSLQTLMQAAQAGMQALAPLMKAAQPPNPAAEAAQAETARKGAADQADNAIKGKDLELKGQDLQLKGQQLQLTAKKVTGDQALDAQKLKQEGQRDAAELQTAGAAIAQRADAAELASETKEKINVEDNQTALVIAGMETTEGQKTDVSTGTGLGE